MANAPFSGEFESLARQYWNTWNELLGRGGMPDGWGLAGGLPPGMGRMDPGAYDWYQRMQRLAADFSGGGNASDIASAWRDMLGGHGADPFAGMLRSMHGGLAGGDWLEQMRPLLDMLLRPIRQQSADWLQRPAFGPAREHQERLQTLALAWQDWEQRNEAFTALLARAGQGAFERFERLLQAHDAPGKRLESARALFDLWIDAAEEAWAEIAMSAEYRHAYAEMTNALMRLRLGLQREVEQFAALLGMPGRGELDALHRKVADLERTLHAAQRGAAATDKSRAAPAARGRAAPVAAAAAEGVAAGSAYGVEKASAATVPAPGEPVRKPPTRKSTAIAHTSPARKNGKKAAAGRTRPARKSAANRRVVDQVAGRASPSRSSGRAAARPKPAASRTATTSTAAVVPSASGRAAAKPRSVSTGTRATAARRTKTDTMAAKRKPAKAQAGAAGTPAKARSATGIAATAKSASPRTPHAALRKRAPTVRKAKEATASVAASTPAPATRKSASASPRHAPAKAAARRAPQASTATARKARVAKNGSAHPTATPAAAGPSAATAKVVSMKDWVSRNLAAAQPDAGSPGGKHGGRSR